MSKFMLLLGIALVSGCASRQAFLSPEEQGPTSRKGARTGHSDAQLIVALDQELRDEECVIRLLVDGRPGLDLSGEQVAYLHVTMGGHRVAAKPNAACVFAEGSEMDVAAKSGDALLWHLGRNGFKPGLPDDQ